MKYRHPFRAHAGSIIPGGWLTVYAGGEGATQKAEIFADPYLTTPLPNPIQADAAGRYPGIYTSTLRRPAYANDDPPRDDAGALMPGATLTFFSKDCTELAPVYADELLTEQIANPLVADENGVFPAAYLDNARHYRAVLKDQFGRLVYDLSSLGQPEVTGQLRLVVESADQSETRIDVVIPQILYRYENSKLWPWQSGVDPRHSWNEYVYTFAEGGARGGPNDGATGGDANCAAVGDGVYGLGEFSSLESAVVALNAAWTADEPGNRQYSTSVIAYSAVADRNASDRFTEPPTSEDSPQDGATPFQRWTWLHLPIAGLEPDYVLGTTLRSAYDAKPAGSLIFSVMNTGAVNDNYPRSFVSQKGEISLTAPWHFGLRQIVSAQYAAVCSGASLQHRAYGCAVARVERFPGKPESTASLTSGTFQVLQQFQNTSGTGTGDPQKHPLSPCLPDTDPRYSDQEFWESAYAEAVTDGQMASGLTFGTDYPVEQNWAYRIPYFEN